MKSMYKAGKQIKSIPEFAECQSWWYKWHGKTTHRSVLVSLQYRTLENAIRNGDIYIAEHIEASGKQEEQND